MEAMRENLPAKTKMIGVVKTDGYGHGAVPVAKTIAPFVWGYAVATLEEGQNLRRHGIDKPILVLGSTHPRHFAELIEGDIRPAIRAALKTCGFDGKDGENAYCARYRHGTNRISPG